MKDEKQNIQIPEGTFEGNCSIPVIRKNCELK